MGLRLFIAPVESDVPEKPATKSPADPAHSRSPIRRVERRRQLRETREHRLRLLAALQGNESNLNLPNLPSETTGEPTRRGWPYSRRSPFDSDLDDIQLADIIRGEYRREGLQPNASSDLTDTESSIREELNSQFFSSADPWGSTISTEGPNQTRLMMRTTARPARTLQASRRSPATSRVRVRNDDETLTSTGRSSRPTDRDTLDEFRWRRDRMRAPTSALLDDGAIYGAIRDLQQRSDPFSARRDRMVRTATSSRNVDGLGDRDRSLSPEGDGVWDTLQSTLTPDPQPPSVGSSFASTTASAAASQITASSSNTSISNHDEVEPPCDPAPETSDSNGEGDDEVEDGHSEPSRRPTAHTRRSYADVAAEETPSRDEGNERSDWLTDMQLSDMQQIVQRLASRHDIPDEWWAAAGLSRSMTWDESGLTNGV